ncbi:MAG: hypothetical protein ACEQSK_08280, partial [Sphingomonadaceae bacterium]
MKPYQIVMALALAGAAGLVLFGDRSSSSDVAEPVERASRAPESKPVAASRAAPGEVMILPLLPRAELIGAAGEGSFASADGVFDGQNWNPPPPPPP